MAANRDTQQPSEIVIDATPNARVTQVPAEITLDATPDAAISQLPAEVVIDALNNAKVTQVPIEILIDHLGNVLTQVPAEITIDGQPHGVLSQMAAEILIDSNANTTTCCLSFADMSAQLAARLYDPTFQFWTQAELVLYLQEAMQTWQALTGYWRGDFMFQPVANQTWYDIPSLPNSLRQYTIPDSQILTVAEYHLLEPPTGGGLWTGSAQFALSDLTTALSRRKEELAGITGCTWARITVPAIPGRTALPTNVVDLRRVTFIPAPGFGDPITLWQSDQWAYQSFSVGYTTNQGPYPTSFSVSTEPWLTFDVDVQPGVPGTYSLLVIQSEPNCAEPNIPDDWQWVSKWGMLADVLSRESNAKDPLRAKYCEQRYQQGLRLLANAPALLMLQVNGVPIWQDSVRSMDAYQVGWEALAPGPPTLGVTAGLNLLALSPPPDSSTAYSVTVTVIENAPVTQVMAGCLAISRELVDLLTDYAQHLASFKMGGEEFVATEQLYNRFMQYAAMYSSRQGEQGEFQRVLWEISQRQEDADPRYSADAEPGRE